LLSEKSGMLNNLSISTWRLLIVFAGALLFFPFLGQVHLFDWDEINFAECAREMLESGDYLNVQIDYLPFWEKPPLFIWMQVLSMKVFGIYEYAARFPNAVCGILSLLFLFEAGRKWYSLRLGLIWAGIYLASLLPFFYFKTGIIDPWFNLFIIASVYFLIRYFQKTGWQYAVLSALAAGLAVLTKGPAAVVIIGLTLFVFLLIKKFRVKVNGWHIPLYLLVFILTGGAWFLMQLACGNTEIIMDFIRYQIRLFTTEDAGHGGFFLYHFVIVFLGAAPASVLAIPSLLKRDGCHSPEQRDFHLWMIILFWVVMILFSIVKTKIVHYSSLSYYPLTFIAALQLLRISENKSTLKRWMKVLLAVNFSLLSLVIAVMPFFDRIKYHIISSGMIKDDFATGNMLANGDWNPFITLLCIASLGVFLFVLFSPKISSFRKMAVLGFVYVFFNFSVMYFVTPSVEKYSQHAAIEFLKSLQGQDVYVYTAGHKSYAHLFYQKKPFRGNDMKWDEATFMTGKADKKVYVIMKINRAPEYLQKYPALQFIRSENGFVFAEIEAGK